MSLFYLGVCLRGWISRNIYSANPRIFNQPKEGLANGLDWVSGRICEWVATETHCQPYVGSTELTWPWLWHCSLGGQLHTPGDLFSARYWTANVLNCGDVIICSQQRWKPQLAKYLRLGKSETFVGTENSSLPGSSALGGLQLISSVPTCCCPHS